MPASPTYWEDTWNAIADAVRLASQTGAVIPNRAALMAAAGVSQAENPSHKAITGMMAAGRLSIERKGTLMRFALPGEDVATAWPEQRRRAAPVTRMGAVLHALETAIANGTPLADWRSLGEMAKLRGDEASRGARKAADAGLIQRVTRRTTEGHGQVSFRLVETGKATPWAMLPIGAHCKPAEGPRLTKIPEPRTLGTAPGDGIRIKRDAAIKMTIHKARMKHARPQTEAEIRATIDHYIAQHGVTRIMPAPPVDGAMPAAPRTSGGGQIAARRHG